MSRNDYNWIAEVLAVMYQKGDVTSDGLNYFIERMENRNTNFDKKMFAAAFDKMTTMLMRRVNV